MCVFRIHAGVSQAGRVVDDRKKKFHSMCRSVNTRRNSGKYSRIAAGVCPVPSNLLVRLSMCCPGGGSVVLLQALVYSQLGFGHTSASCCLSKAILQVGQQACFVRARLCRCFGANVLIVGAATTVSTLNLKVLSGDSANASSNASKSIE